MKYAMMVLATLLVLSGAPAAARADAAVGAPAPEFSLTDTNGQNRSLADFKGTFVVLEWFNNDCPFVKKHYDSGNMQRLQQQYTQQGIVWLTISSSAPGKQGHIASPQDGQRIVEARQAHQTALLLDPDGAVGRRYGAKTTPHMFVVNPEGVLIYAGAIDDKASTDAADIPGVTNYVERALAEAMAGQAVSASQTQSYGCSVKY